MLCDRFFFITCRLFHGCSHLDESEFELLAGAIQSRRAAQGFRLTAWVFLPDHWHAILFPHCPATISAVMESIKVSSTRRMNAKRKGVGRVWQGCFFDRALRTVEEYHEKVNYIHLNPVKAGLVSKAEEWKGSSVHDYTGSVTAPVGTEPRAAEFLESETLRHPLSVSEHLSWSSQTCTTSNQCNNKPTAGTWQTDSSGNFTQADYIYNCSQTCKKRRELLGGLAADILNGYDIARYHKRQSLGYAQLHHYQLHQRPARNHTLAPLVEYRWRSRGLPEVGIVQKEEVVCEQ
ncbi:MAG: REP-associated tyrosine transposase [Terriglobia bacterium]